MGGDNAARLWVRLVQVKFILLDRNKHTETNVCDNGIFQMKKCRQNIFFVKFDA